MPTQFTLREAVGQVAERAHFRRWNEAPAARESCWLHRQIRSAPPGLAVQVGRAHRLHLADPGGLERLFFGLVIRSGPDAVERGRFHRPTRAGQAGAERGRFHRGRNEPLVYAGARVGVLMAAFEAQELVPALACAFEAPTLANQSPAPGDPLGVLDPIGFEVFHGKLGPSAFLVAVEVAGSREIAHDGQAFCGRFVHPKSTKTAIEGGARYQLWRAGGWTASPTVIVYLVAG